MDTIYVAGGVGVAPTAMAAYDAALADVNLHNYNLVRVSSVIPASASVRLVDAAPDLGPAGNRLTVVQGKAIVGPEGTAATPESTTGGAATSTESTLEAAAATSVGESADSAEPGTSVESTPAEPADSGGTAATSASAAAAIGWATGPGPGLFYEAAGDDPTAVERAVERGLEAGCALREWSFTDRETHVASAAPVAGSYTAAVVVAAYGESEPVF